MLVMRLRPDPGRRLRPFRRLLLPHFYVNFKRKRRLKKFSNEFPNAVDVIVRGVKAGLPLIDCLKIIARGSAGAGRAPSSSEIVEDQTLGMPLAEAVARLPERIPLAEANFFAIVDRHPVANGRQPVGGARQPLQGAARPQEDGRARSAP